MNGRKEDIRLLEQSDLFEGEMVKFTPFKDKEIEEISYFATSLDAKLAIASHLGRPLATLLAEQRQQIDVFIAQTLHKESLLNKVRNYFKPHPCDSNNASLMNGSFNILDKFIRVLRF